MIFLISDTHFLHANVIKYSNRPFDDVHEMNAELMKRWNSVVKEDDLVIHAGDFMFGNKKLCGDILNRLNGEKILVSGNHDPKQVTQCPEWKDCVQSLEFEYDDYLFKIKHFPWQTELTKEIDLYTVWCHGHTHGYNGKFDRNQVDLSVECWNYTPVSIEEVIKQWNQHVKTNHATNS